MSKFSFSGLPAQDKAKVLTTIFFFLMGLLPIIWPSLIAPLTFLSPWQAERGFWEGVVNAWPLFAWGIGVSTLCFFVPNRYQQEPIELFGNGLLTSLCAGVLEEILFRWIIFFGAIISAGLFDWLILGFMGLHPLRWITMEVVAPVADYFTLGFLTPQLSGLFGWTIAAGIIASNGEFRDGHGYLGIIGLVNSWFIGMFLFSVMFTYGLLTAIVIHFLYDLLIFTVRSIDAALEKRRLIPS
jgi:hypothetical protein